MFRYFSLFLLLLLSACTSNPKLALPPLPLSVTEKMPMHVALIHDSEFRHYEFNGNAFKYNSEDAVAGMTSFKLHYSLGELNTDLFRHVTSSMFTQVTIFDSWDAMTASGKDFDGILVPKISKFNSWYSEAGGMAGYLGFEITLYDEKKQQVIKWPVNSNQTSCMAGTNCKFSLKADEEIVLALRRDIAAQILTQFLIIPEVIAWKSSHAGRP